MIIKDLPALAAFAHDFAAQLRGGQVIGLVGDLGAGKTALTQRLAAALGVREPVKSPTFILMQTFKTDANAKMRGIARLCHVDAYRLKDHAELEAIGFGEFAGASDTVAIVEWADRVPELHQMKEYLELTISVSQMGERRITLGG